MFVLDIRTIAFTSLLLHVLLAVTAFLYARVHISYRDFIKLGSAYSLLACGYVFIGFRNFIIDFFSIIIANLFIAYGFSIVILALLSALNYHSNAFKRFTDVSIVLLGVLFLYFTYIDADINARIIFISILLGVQSLYAGIKILSYEGEVNRVFIALLSAILWLCSVIFAVRVYITINTSSISNYMDAGTIHAVALLSLLVVSVASCFVLSWLASHRLAKNLEVQATIDALTKVYNRGAIEKLAEKDINRAKREDSHLSIILMDIDFFKQVNDKYGHQTGDVVLQEFSRRLTEHLRPYDNVGRYGGEEFILLLPQTDKKTALVIAEKLRDVIYQPVFNLETQLSIAITASFGVASQKGKAVSWLDLVEQADQAMYHAKNSGRNQVKSVS